MVLVKAMLCPYDPTPLLGQPLGMFHCPFCGCMVVAGVVHGPCFKSLCPAYDEGWHPAPIEVGVEVTEEAVETLGLEVISR